VFFASKKVYDSISSIIASSLLTSIIAILFWGAGLITFHYVVICVLLFILGIGLKFALK
jgi:fucose permease